MSQHLELLSAEEIERQFDRPDPWNYEQTQDDAQRRDRLLALLPPGDYEHALDIGCSDGFITFSLPGRRITGLEPAQSAIAYAQAKTKARTDADRYRFIQGSVFDLQRFAPEQFDLIVVTGVLYRQYIGHSMSLVRLAIDRVLRAKGILAACHIDEWYLGGFPYTRLDESLYAYREFTHRLEVYQK